MESSITETILKASSWSYRRLENQKESSSGLNYIKLSFRKVRYISSIEIN